MHLIICALLVFVASEATGQTTVAQDADPQIRLASGDVFVETLREGALIAGSVVAGVLVRESGSHGHELRGYIPADWRGQQVCLQMSSIEGLYEATGLYQVPQDWPGGIVPFEFPTTHGERLEETPGDGLAIRFTQGACDEAGRRDHAVALWNADALTEVDLLLNSFRADTVFAYVGADPQPIRCEPIDFAGRIAFDSKCSLDVDGLSGTVKLEIYRVVDGTAAEPDTVLLYLPAA